MLEGGGVLGIAFVGAIKALEESGYEINRVAGTSAGSIVAAFIHAGYHADELIDIMKETDFSSFRVKTKLSKIPLFGFILSLFKNKGIYSNRHLKIWLDSYLKMKDAVTFDNLDLLKIIASDITNRSLFILPDDLKNYGIDYQTFHISDAVLMSSSIPYFFVPYYLKYQNKRDFIVDGGLLSNFPVWIFDVDDGPKLPTIGIKVKDSLSLTSQNKTSILSYTKDIINSVINKEELSYVRNKDLIRTIIIDHDQSIKSTDFGLTRLQMDYLFECGYQSAIRFLDRFDLSDYIEQF